MEPNYKFIGKRVRKTREQVGVSQESLADAVGISVPHLSNIENGKTKLSLSVLIRIANTLNVSVDYILCDNLRNCEAIYHHDLYHILQDSSVAELRIIHDTNVALIDSLRKNTSSLGSADYDLLKL